MTGSLERVSLARPDQDALIAQVRDAAFPLALRGYDREAVDAYVKRVNRLITDLEASRSPEAAIRRALDQVGEETAGILQRAQQTANEITERSRASADDRIREAEAQVRGMTVEAEDRVRALEADYGAIWARRDQLLEEVRDLAERLLATADDAAERFPTQEDEGTVDEDPPDTASFPRLEMPRAEITPASAFGAAGAEELEDEPPPTTSLEAREPALPDRGRDAADEQTDDEADPASHSSSPRDAEGGDEPAGGGLSSADEIDFADAPDDDERDLDARSADEPSGERRSL